ncbi:MAG: heavy metal-binding domain-containing protein [Urechidicola sp.]|nr:heavy metal-binding domain-containing protein [Urechidicola sp.]
MKKVMLSIALLVVIGFTSCKSEKKEEKSTIKTEEVVVEEMASVEYQCPMKCEDDKTYHEKGKCPVCKMALVEVEHDMEHDHEMHKTHDKDTVVK